MIRSIRKLAPLITLLVIVFGLALPMVVGAQAETFDIKKGIIGNLSTDCREFGNCGWCDFIELVVVLQKVILSLFGGLALVMFIWGGQGIIMAAGNQEKVMASKKLLTSTLFGVLIILAAYFLVNILVGILISPVGTPMQTKIWNADWWRAYCIKDITDPTYCQGKPRGLACGKAEDNFVCDNGACNLLTCTGLAKQNPGYNIVCQDLDCKLATQREYGGYCANTQKCCGNQ